MVESLRMKGNQRGQRGFNYIFNPLPDEELFEATYKLVAERGNYHQMSFPLINTKKTIGEHDRSS